MRTRLGHALLCLAIVGLPAAALAGCTAAPTSFPSQILGADGEPILLDAVEDIVNDADLTDDEKREQLRALGLEDEELIEALLGL